MEFIVNIFIYCVILSGLRKIFESMIMKQYDNMYAVVYVFTLVEIYYHL